MSHKFQCQVCALELTVSDQLFAERIEGKSLSVRCKRCKALLSITGEGQQVKLLGVTRSEETHEATTTSKSLPGSSDTPHNDRPAPSPSEARSEVKATDAAGVTHSRRTAPVPTAEAPATPVATPKPQPKRSATTAARTQPPRPGRGPSATFTTNALIGSGSDRSGNQATPTAPNQASALSRTASSATIARPSAVPRPATPLRAPRLASDGSLGKPSRKDEVVAVAAPPNEPPTEDRAPAPRNLPVQPGSQAEMNSGAAASALPSSPPVMAPMPIVSLGVESPGAVTNEDPPEKIESLPNASDEPAVAPPLVTHQTLRPVLPRASLHSDVGDSEPELTPPAATLALDNASTERQATADPKAPLATAHFSGRRSNRRKKGALVGVASVMVAAVTLLGVGLMRGRTGARSKPPVDMPTVAAQTVEAKPVVGSAVTPTVPEPIRPTAATHVDTSNDVARHVDTHLDAGATGGGIIPDYVFRPAVIHLTGQAIHRGERCHPGGHAVGTARVFFTFSPNGRVIEARIEGEPIASAPVARCILDHARAIQMRKFDGPAFTVSFPITLR